MFVLVAIQLVVLLFLGQPELLALGVDDGLKRFLGYLKFFLLALPSTHFALNPLKKLSRKCGWSFIGEDGTSETGSFVAMRLGVGIVPVWRRLGSCRRTLRIAT